MCHAAVSHESRTIGSAWIARLFTPQLGACGACGGTLKARNQQTEHSARPHSLNAHLSIAGSISVDEHDALPLPQRHLAVNHRDGLAATEKHGGEVGVRINGLLGTPTL